MYKVQQVGMSVCVNNPPSGAMGGQKKSTLTYSHSSRKKHFKDCFVATLSG